MVGDALAIPQALIRLAYFTKITLWTTFLLHRYHYASSLVLSLEMLGYCAFSIIAINNLCIMQTFVSH